MANTKVKKVHPFQRVEEWSLVSKGLIKAIYINPDWGINFYDGMSLDVENDPVTEEMIGIGIYDHKLNVGYYWTEPWQSKLVPKFIAYNGLSDLGKLKKWGFTVTDEHLLNDPMLDEHIEDSSLITYGLKDVCKRKFGYEWPSYDEICGSKTSKKRKTLKEFDPKAVAEYTIWDCFGCHKLNELKRTTENKEYYVKLESPVSVVFDAMKNTGIRIDLKYLSTLESSLSSQMKTVETKIKNELGDINLDSPKQLLEALNAKEIYPKFKGKPSTDKRALERFKTNGLVSSLLHYSELSTLVTGFVSPYLAQGNEIIHPNYLQTGTRTGRPSCSKPNLLNIPKKGANGQLVRAMFIPRLGKRFGELDYGQIEPRMLAILSQNQTMMEMFNSDVDFHDFFAKKVNVDRPTAKVFDLETYYRATKYGVSRTLKCDYKQAQRYIDDAWNAFPGLKEWETKILWEAARQGYVTTLMGRRIKIDGLDDKRFFVSRQTGEKVFWIRDAAERQTMNNLAQGSATEVMKKAMVAVHNHNVSILVQVYDSLLIEDESIEEAVELTKDLMINTTKLDVPLTVDTHIGDNWAACKGN